MPNAQHDPTEQELTEYVRYRLGQIGPAFAEPEYVDDAVVFQRDLWLLLYNIEREFGTGHFANPS